MTNEEINLQNLKADTALRSTVFFSSILYNLNIKFTNSIPTAATNGLDLLINPDYFNGLDRKERLFLAIHEVCHIVYQHLSRRGDRDKLKFNMAADYAINGYLESNGFTVIEGGLIDSKYRNMTTEAIYNKIPDKEVDTLRVGEFFQDIIESASKKDIDKINKTISDAYSVQKSYSKSSNKLPKEIEELLDNLIDPVLPWQSLLQAYVTDFSKEDYSMRVPNRRHLANDMYISSLYSETVNNVIIAIDCSGSVTSEEFNSFLSEVVSIRETVTINKLTIFQFDTSLHSITEFTPDMAIGDMKLYSGGGTDICPVLDYTDKQNPNLLIVFTDLEFSKTDHTEKYPTLWVCIDNPSAKEPFGDRIDYRPNK